MFFKCIEFVGIRLGNTVETLQMTSLNHEFTRPLQIRLVFSLARLQPMGKED